MGMALFIGAPAHASTPQSLGQANTFVILSSTYTNTAGGTTLVGNLGYTTPPAVAPTITGATHVADSIYNQAGIDQGNALASLNSQVCTFNFAPGPVDLASDTTHGPVGVYSPGVYCITGAASIGGGGTITLTGTGTYIFRMNGALTTSANSIVAATGASACDVWWTPTGAATLGANSTFLGTVMDASGITIGNNVTWTGQALAFGGTAATTADSITSPTCPAARAVTPALSSSTPVLPNTGNTGRSSSMPLVGLLVTALTGISTVYFIRRKRKYSASL
jgi:LPXTG-motif cell wall-anchored protein